MRAGPSPRASTTDMSRPATRPIAVTTPYQKVLRTIVWRDAAVSTPLMRRGLSAQQAVGHQHPDGAPPAFRDQTRHPAGEQGEALSDDADVPPELAAAAGRRWLHRKRVAVESARVPFERGLDGMEQIVDLGRAEVAIDLAAERRDRSVGAGDESEHALARLDEGLVPHVAVADRAWRLGVAGDIEALAAHQSHARIVEAGGEPGERVRPEERVGVGEDQEIARSDRDPAIQGQRLSGARLLADEPDPT